MSDASCDRLQPEYIDLFCLTKIRAGPLWLRSDWLKYIFASHICIKADTSSFFRIFSQNFSQWVLSNCDTWSRCICILYLLCSIYYKPVYAGQHWAQTAVPMQLCFQPYFPEASRQVVRRMDTLAREVTPYLKKLNGIIDKYHSLFHQWRHIKFLDTTVN